MLKKIGILAFATLVMFSCKKDTNPNTDAQLQFQFKFDKTQERLNNIGLPSGIPANHAAQTPEFQKLSVHYIELAPNAFTALGKGAIVYTGAETTKGGENAVDFDKAAVNDQNQVFAKINLKDVPPGTYEWVRASVTYQEYEILFNINNVPVVGNLLQQKGTIASFVGFNTYISTLKVREKTLAVNDDKKQGFWGFETNLSAPYQAYNNLFSGETAAGATTVVNPLASSSPIPAGSCVVTGRFVNPLVITGNENEDITVNLSFSINKSFEWKDDNGNGQLDIYADQSTPAEKITDMGLRGLIPSF